MKTIIAAAALSLTALAASPAAAWDPIYNSPNNTANVTSPGAWYGYDAQRYPSGYGYGYGDPAWRSGASQIAICPPGYHLGRDARLCWPD